MQFFPAFPPSAVDPHQNKSYLHGKVERVAAYKLKNVLGEGYGATAGWDSW